MLSTGTFRRLHVSEVLAGAALASVTGLVAAGAPLLALATALFAISLVCPRWWLLVGAIGAAVFLPQTTVIAAWSSDFLLPA